MSDPRCTLTGHLLPRATAERRAAEIIGAEAVEKLAAAELLIVTADRMAALLTERDALRLQLGEAKTALAQSDDSAEAWAAAVQRARAEALDEAARVVERARILGTVHLAATIRALKVKEGKQ